MQATLPKGPQNAGGANPNSPDALATEDDQFEIRVSDQLRTA